MFHLGQKFSDFKEVVDARKNYEKQNNCKLVVSSSKTLGNAYKKKTIENLDLNWNLVFDEIYFKCATKTVDLIDIGNDG